jgi:hypothetical protein
LTPTLRDALAAARINRLKARIARAWAQRQREAEASECNCFACLIRRGMVPGIRLPTEADHVPPPADKSHH